MRPDGTVGATALGAAGTGVVELLDLLRPPALQLDALCREPAYRDVSFFPARGEPTGPAKDVCRRCLVRDECESFALDHEDRDLPVGIWGGMSARERRQRRPPAPAKPAECLNCGQPAKVAGRCQACHSWHRRTGRERPMCVVCGVSAQRRWQRCPACASYLERTGQDRPPGVLIAAERRRDEERLAGRARLREHS